MVCPKCHGVGVLKANPMAMSTASYSGILEKKCPLCDGRKEIADNEVLPRLISNISDMLDDLSTSLTSLFIIGNQIVTQLGIITSKMKK